jgi:tetratricopeptide (TPR) repeat protein
MTQSEHLFRALVYIEDLLDEGKIETASQLCVQLLDQFPNDSDLLFVYAITLQLNNERPLAIQILKRLTHMIPNSCETWNHLSLLLFEEREFTSARSVLDSALDLEPQNAFSWWMYSVLRLFCGDPSGGKRAYLYAQWLEPDTYFSPIPLEEETLLNLLKKAILLLSPPEQQYCTALIWNIRKTPTTSHLEQLQISPLLPLIHIEISKATLHLFQYNIENLKKEEPLLVSLLREELSYILKDTLFSTVLA